EAGGDHEPRDVQRLARGGELGGDGRDAAALDPYVAGGVEPRLGVEHVAAREDDIVLLAAEPRRSPAPGRHHAPAQDRDEYVGDGEPSSSHGLVQVGDDRPILVGSSASRTASPSSVHATTTSTSATPGAVATQCALTSVSRPEAIMLPHDGVGGCTPRPRNERLASSMIALPTPSAAATMTGVSAFGRMWRPSTRLRDAPSARAPSTNGRTPSERTSPYTRRATDIHPVMPSTTITSAALGRHSAASSRRSTTRGSASAKSVMPSSSVRTGPPQWPATAPTAPPIASESSTASPPTPNDTRAPYTSRVHTSRPKRSVPSAWKAPRPSVASGGRKRVATMSRC